MPDADREITGTRNLCGASDFSVAHILRSKKEKKVAINSKYYRDHQCTYNILIMQLIYLHIDSETFDLLSTLVQIRGVIGLCKYLR